MTDTSQQNVTWGDEQVAALRGFVEQRLTRRAIAEAMTKQFNRKFTKNGVIAKAAKLGLDAATNTSGFFWSERELSELRALWPSHDNDYIAKRLTEMFGRPFTAGSVRHKGNGIGLRRRARVPPVIINRIGQQLKHPQESQVVDFSSIPMSQRKTLLELENHHCRYIVGDPMVGDYFYCGAVQKDGSSYCAEHHARCFERRSAGVAA